MLRRGTVFGVVAGLIAILAINTFAQFRNSFILPDPIPEPEQHPGAEFRMARVKYLTFGGGGSHGIRQPWWAIDYPYAEEHFFAALRRVTNITVADRETFVELSDDQIFQYPFLFLQAVGVGDWNPTAKEAAPQGTSRSRRLHAGRRFPWGTRLGDLRTGHSASISGSGNRRNSGRHPLMHIFYDLDKKTAIPGDRQLRVGPGGKIYAQMQGPAHWRAIYDDHKRIMVAMNFNIDMGDSWEHADDAFYPVPMTAWLQIRNQLHYLRDDPLTGTACERLKIEERLITCRQLCSLSMANSKSS
jgi:hypothetical protein